MGDYGIVAFYRETESEVSGPAEALMQIYHLHLRYEKVPQFPEAIASLAGQDTVFCVFERTVFKFRRLMQYVYALNKPCMIVHRKDMPGVYHHLKVPVGYSQENKEKVVWANFLQRNDRECQVELVVPEEKDEHIAFMVKNNLAFIENILQKSGARYARTFPEGSFEKNLKRTFQESNGGVVLIMRPFRIFSFYFPYVLRLFRKYARTPVLIIPRDDSLYVPCH
ncbi:hypothetical protein [Odoribacter sp. Z80]|uniref:hypothetical protein n=1 Tax=Odoribacter sp. Z80 TaxID=2304575 RepID=UPI00137AC014|nr:hypothetical protein [Odoribacter sp. Z80]NCE72890.1 hypothetical protein [Odoribacter sp. Z80]